MRKPVSAGLLEKYVKGDCSPVEIAQIKEWYDSFEHDDDFVSGIGSADEQKLAEGLYRRIASDIVTHGQKGIRKYRILQPLFFASAGIAAALLIVFGLFFTPDHAYDAEKFSNAAPQLNQQVRITNNTRTIYKAVLPDNSVVWISPGSKLNYPEKFGPNVRLVTMSGECFFEVTKNPDKPFIITSNSIVTKVWGTSFRVRDSEGAGSAEVSVLTGKVSVSVKKQNKNVSPAFKNDEVMLHSDQKITYLRNQHILKTQKETKKSSVKIWKRVNLSFESAPLKSIVPMLNSSYGARIEIDNNQLNDYLLTADFDGFNLPEVLDALKKSLNINYEIRNDETILLR